MIKHQQPDTDGTDLMTSISWEVNGDGPIRATEIFRNIRLFDEEEQPEDS